MKKEEAKIRKDSIGGTELTRREWMLRLGEAAALFGFTGSLPEVEAKAASALSLLAPEVKTLPAGLYDSSSEHMAQALISDERFLKIPPGSETDYVRPREGAYTPQFFTPGEFEVVTRLVRLTLGEISEPAGAEAETRGTKGGILAEVAEWIDLAVANAASVREAARRLAPEHKAVAVRYYGSEVVDRLENADPEKTCREGLEWLEEESRRHYARAFMNLEESRQIRVMDSISDARPDVAHENPGTRLFAFLKRETIRGFYTSRVGLKELDYKGNAFYVECPGCTGKNE